MPDQDRNEGRRGPSIGAPVSITFTDEELALVREYAEAEGLSIEEAVERLGSGGLAHRVRAGTGHRPSAAVTQFHKNKRSE